MSEVVTVHLFSQGEHSFLWTDISGVPSWRFLSPHPRKWSRRQRIYTNALVAYHSMLVGAFHIKDIEVITYGIEPIDFSYPQRRKSFSEGVEAMSHIHQITYSLHTPYFSLPEMRWSDDPSRVEPHHVYVDASVIPKGPEGIPVSCFAVYSVYGLEIHDLETNSSADAEYQGIQSALRIGHKLSQELNSSVTVFADCGPAITRTLIKREVDHCPYLGESVFVQWIPGHGGYEGMSIVHNAAIERVRELIA